MPCAKKLQCKEVAKYQQQQQKWNWKITTLKLIFLLEDNWIHALIKKCVLIWMFCPSSSCLWSDRQIWNRWIWAFPGSLCKFTKLILHKQFCIPFAFLNMISSYKICLRVNNELKYCTWFLNTSILICGLIFSCFI